MLRFAPSERLAPLVRTFTVVEADQETTRTLVPDAAVTLGFRYGGSARLLNGAGPIRMPDASLTGMHAQARRMCTSAGGGVILAMLHETAAAQLLAQPHELFGTSVALDQLFPRAEVERTQARIAGATQHHERLALLEQFLLAQQRVRAHRPDPLVAAAVGSIRAARGSIRVSDLAARLGLGLDPLEKRFRRAVGASPKQLASIIRMRHAVDAYRPGASLTRLSLEAGYFDQSHFIREFRSVTGQAPGRFFRTDQHC